MVTSPFALMDFIAAIFFFGRQSYKAKLQKLLETVPEIERFKLVEAGFTRCNLSAADLKEGLPEISNGYKQQEFAHDIDKEFAKQNY